MKIFFAVDGSSDASEAVRLVGGLLSPRTDAVAFYFAPPEIDIRHAHDSAAMLERARRAIADAVFGDVRALLPGELATGATTIMAEHTPSEGIRIEAEKWGADVIVVGARGHSQVDKWFLGSVADGVAQNSKLPVLVVRRRPEDRAGRPWRILYGYDGSESSTAALRVVEQFSWPAETSVTALAVVEGFSTYKLPDWVVKKARDADTEAMAKVWERSVEEDKRQARDEMAAFMAKQPGPFAKAESLVCEGHAAEQILRLVDERQIDLVVLGARGRNMLERMFLGSTTDRILNQAHCSVLIVRGK